MFVDWNTIALLWPEIILIAAATWLFVVGSFFRARAWWTVFAAASYVTAGVVLLLTEGNGAHLTPDGAGVLSGPLVADFLGYHLRWLSLLVGLLFTLISARNAPRELTSELLGILMLIVAGVMLTCRANDLVFLFVSLELVSIPTYVLLFLGRKDRTCGEATAKYFFLSVFSSALLLYGLSFLYGMSGTTALVGEDSIRSALTSDAAGQGVMLEQFGLLLVFAGLGFKIAAAPFHFYAPDVYEGSTNPNAGLLAVAPKIAGMVALIRLTVIAAPSSEFAWQVAMVMAVLTMTIGNVCALWQTNLRRLMAYSSIAHAGYMLIGLSVALAVTPEQTAYGGVSATVFYLMVYVLGSIGFFSLLNCLVVGSKEVNTLKDLAGLGRRRPTIAAGIAICMFSLAGIPPLAGFWGKLTLFYSAIGTALSNESMKFWFLSLAVIGAINAAIAAAYYLRVVGTMYFDSGPQPESETPVNEPASGIAAAVSLLLLLIVGLAPGPFIQNAKLAEEQARSTGDLSQTTVQTDAETPHLADR